MNDKNETWTVFGDRLKSELERQGLTLTQISKKTGMPLPTLSRYAKAQRIPLATQILRIANALGVTCDYMLGLSDDPHKTRFGTEFHRTEPGELIYKQAAYVAAIEAADKWDGGYNVRRAHMIEDAIKALPSVHSEDCMVKNKEG